MTVRLDNTQMKRVGNGLFLRWHDGTRTYLFFDNEKEFSMECFLRINEKGRKVFGRVFGAELKKVRENIGDVVQGFTTG